MRIVVVGLSIPIFCAGLIAYAYTEELVYSGITQVIGYPYRDLGLVLLALSVVILIVGFALPTPKKTSGHPTDGVAAPS